MAYPFGLSQCPLMLQEQLTSPQALPVSKHSRLTTEAHGTTALGSAGTASATGNLPSKVTVSPAAPQRAHCKTKSSEVYRAWSKGHWNQRLLLISTHFLVIGRQLPNSLFWCYLHIHITNCLISLNRFQLPPTELLNPAYLDCSPLKEGTTQPGEVYLVPFTPNHQALAPWLGKTVLPIPSSLSMATSEFAPSRLWVRCLIQRATPNRDQRQDPSILCGCSKLLRLRAQHLPWLTSRQWDKSQTFYCLTDFS